jgi:hypothetical protein
MAILTDVGSYSREYTTCRQRLGRRATDNGDTKLEIEYEKILAAVVQRYWELRIRVSKPAFAV